MSGDFQGAVGSSGVYGIVESSAPSKAGSNYLADTMKKCKAYVARSSCF